MNMDKMQLFCTRIRAAASAPGWELAGDLLQKMQRLDDFK